MFLHRVQKHVQPGEIKWLEKMCLNKNRKRVHVCARCMYFVNDAKGGYVMQTYLKRFQYINNLKSFQYINI